MNITNFNIINNFSFINNDLLLISEFMLERERERERETNLESSRAYDTKNQKISKNPFVFLSLFFYSFTFGRLFDVVQGFFCAYPFSTKRHLISILPNLPVVQVLLLHIWIGFTLCIQSCLLNRIKNPQVFFNFLIKHQTQC